MLTLYPIEGNGWYKGENRIRLRQPFVVDIKSQADKTHFSGVVVDGPDVIKGLSVVAGQTFINENNWLTVRFYDDVKSQNEKAHHVSGYVQVKKVIDTD